MSGLRRFVRDGAGAGGSHAATRGDGHVAARRGLLGARADRGPEEACEMCAAPLDERHRHVVDSERHGLLCACRPCALLFVDSGAGGGRYVTIPERVWRVDPFELSAEQWRMLQIPVGLAFFLERSTPAQTVVFYPSPAGATESQLPLDAWEDVRAANPALRQLEADTEAALVRFDGDHPECFLVPVDRCYELIGELRLSWRGFDGGHESRDRIAAFFQRLETDSRPAAKRPPAERPSRSADGRVRP